MSYLLVPQHLPIIPIHFVSWLTSVFISHPNIRIHFSSDLVSSHLFASPLLMSCHVILSHLISTRYLNSRHLIRSFLIMSHHFASCLISMYLPHHIPSIASHFVISIISFHFSPSHTSSVIIFHISPYSVSSTQRKPLPPCIAFVRPRASSLPLLLFLSF